jgi:hypothetical protein
LHALIKDSAITLVALADLSVAFIIAKRNCLADDVLLIWRKTASRRGDWGGTFWKRVSQGLVLLEDRPKVSQLVEL